MTKENIKWIAIQPLTGGMYLGAEEAIGHPAKFILSFKGLNYGELKEDLTYKVCENELYLQRYLEKHGRNPIRYDIQEHQFDEKLIETLNPTICADDSEVDLTEEYKDIDLVVAVPVCSGLSMATTASQETKDKRNYNMRFITEYTLKTIKPKIYVFENAPTLMGTRGKDLVEEFKKIAKDNGYSVLFYKTNTKLHHNCQNRPRTFVIFFKHISNNENEEPFVFEYESAQVDIKEFFKDIDNSINGEPINTALHNVIVYDYIKNKYGENWRSCIKKDILMADITQNNEMENLIEFANKYPDNEKAIKYFTHVYTKTSQGLNYFGSDVFSPHEYFPSIQFKTIANLIHPLEERICSVRECLHLMGHPDDFEWLTGNDEKFFPKIGQNVPVKTAKFIVDQCVKCLEKWNEPRGNEFNSSYQDNIKQNKVW